MEMKVKELVELLLQQNQEDTIWTQDSYYDGLPVKSVCTLDNGEVLICN